MPDPILIARADAPGTIGVSPSTFDRLERAGRGPTRVELGARIYYRMSDLEAWLDTLAVAPEPVQ